MTPEDLKKWRTEHGYTQITLSHALRTHSMTISKWERGEREIPSFLHLALDALECKNKEVKKNKGTEKRKRKRRVIIMGMIYKRGETYWVKYYRNGKPYHESSKSHKETDAKKALETERGCQ